jgi:hypothetical protein
MPVSDVVQISKYWHLIHFLTELDHSILLKSSVMINLFIYFN